MSLEEKKLKVNQEVETINIHKLFIEYSETYFEGLLHNSAVTVEWSTRMTLCAGVCYLHRGGYCIIRLSKPLLKYRSVKELKETLLHEMIHAYLFLTKKQTFDDYMNGGHGQVLKRNNCRHFWKRCMKSIRKDHSILLSTIVFMKR